MIFTIIKNKLEQLIRLIFVNSITSQNGSVLVVEYPKSGGTWLGQLIAHSLEIPFPRNRFPIMSRSLYHSHYLPKYRIQKNKPIFFLVRDGRDVMVSLYHHQLLWNEKNKLSPKDVHYHRKNVPFSDFDNVKKNMSAFIKYSFENQPSKWQQFTYMGTWFEFNQAWLKEQKTNGNVHLVHYEDLLADTRSTVSKLLQKTYPDITIDAEKINNVVNQFSFENQASRLKGDEDAHSFLRKGISGDWKNYFGPEECTLFKKYTQNMLVDLGYEADLNW
jgi:hypothetical protein